MTDMETVANTLDIPAKTCVRGLERSKIQHPVMNQVPSKLISAAQKLQVLWFASLTLKNPVKVWKALKQLNALVKVYLGGNSIRKVARVRNRFYWDMYGPSWPSQTFRNHIRAEIERTHYKKPGSALRNVLLAITTHCPLQCEHCYEWDNLNKKEKLSLRDLKLLVSKFQQRGVAQIHFGGGEPMLRFNDILEIMKDVRQGTDFWLVTSGYQLTSEKATELKQSGLTGVSVSLDHYLPGHHNTFRNFNDAFYWAQQAAVNAANAGLVVAMSLCATREFVTWDNLLNYAETARAWGASFIQLLEPKAVGHYNGKDVSHTCEQKQILHDFFIKMNNQKKYQSYPIIIYHEPYLETIGCFGAGNRFLYVDPLANIHACPFCRKAAGNALADDLEEVIDTLRTRGCGSYTNAVENDTSWRSTVPTSLSHSQ
jgi:MoaA/NifB/PqqE/SkfB family radical SAM enzyme